MPEIHAAPWIPPAKPDLGRLAMEAADEEGSGELRAWPEVRGNGIAFRGLPVFLCWRGEEGGRCHLMLFQARELGALVPRARKKPLPDSWLADLDLQSLARPLRRHPDFPTGASLHVVRVVGPGEAQVRTAGRGAPELLREVLARLTGIEAWEFRR